MIEDARGFSPERLIETDICVIGAGAAGLVIARHFAGTRHRICLLESGGLAFERSSQRLSRGASVGLPYEALDLCRVRQFGGSTGRTGWGGWCKPLDPADFEKQDFMPLSGWPIDHAALVPHYAAAAALLGLASLDAGDRAAGDRASARLSPGSPLFSERCFLSPSPDLGEALLPALRDAANVKVVIHATALSLRTDASAQHVRWLEAGNAPGRRFRVRAGIFVLAGGGIENARLLLLSNAEQPGGLGNRHDLVGRCFMEHPRVAWGSLEVSRNRELIDRHDPGFAWQRPKGPRHQGFSGRPAVFGIAVRPEVRAREGLLNSRTWIKPGVAGGQSKGGEALQHLTFWLRKGRFHRDLLKSAADVLRHPSDATNAVMARLQPSRRRVGHFRFVTILEQEPDPQSRVTLDARRDGFGLPRARLDWRVGALVGRTLERVQAMIAEEMLSLGHDCSIGQAGAAAEAAPVGPAFSWVRHHMGTTRMSDSPRTGVVDADCRVHGIGNLFVAGSSVFPTGGNDMPTLTIMALAMRLAEHLRSRLERSTQIDEIIRTAGDPRSRTIEPEPYYGRPVKDNVVVLTFEQRKRAAGGA